MGNHPAAILEVLPCSMALYRPLRALRPFTLNSARSPVRCALRSYHYLISDTGAPSGHYVELLESRLQELLQTMLARVRVDEPWYLATYPDVAEAVQKGTLKSAHDHYIRSGYFENRLPSAIRVDENWYIATYPDVMTAIKSGHVKNGQQHFESNGFKEGRLPTAGWSLLG